MNLSQCKRQENNISEGSPPFFNIWFGISPYNKKYRVAVGGIRKLYGEAIPPPNYFMR